MAETPANPPADPSAYPHRTTVQTRWKDNDVYGHVNNADYYGYFDTVINALLIQEGGLDIHGGETIGLCAESHCKFLGPLAFPGSVDACLRVGHLGSSSVRYELALFDGESGAPAAVGWFVHVFVDAQTRRPSEISSEMRALLERLQQSQ
ncbi:MAG: acyl-CoA thioesterase [Actinobacteria bacterium]|nr:acyl-CoA thioesterase [Actinomycetota bacterium]